MDISHIFDEQNDAQREAVAAEPSPLLILAGAGSGKTRVLISRIAYLVEAHQVSPLSIMAVTFTNTQFFWVKQPVEWSIRSITSDPFGGIRHFSLYLFYRGVFGRPCGNRCGKMVKIFGVTGVSCFV